MGKNLIEIIEASEGMQVSSGVDRSSNKAYNFDQFESFESDGIKGDVIIDFSHYTLVPSLLDYCEKTKTPAVICTTGLDEKTSKRIETLSSQVPLFLSGNMSLGINLMIDLIKKASEILSYDFDVEIIEKHHNKKVDSPSGTALMLANAIKETASNKYFVHGREGNNTLRDKEEIGIHAVRGGTVVGEHQVIFAGTDEIIEIHHKATSKKVFAKGAIKAAIFLKDQKPGLYDMSSVIY
jgi:4-hydroxy-tetrahydrodipicolinate reductase